MLLFRGLVEARHGELDAALATVRGRPLAVPLGRRPHRHATCQALLAEQLAQAGRVGDAAEHVAGARRETLDTGEGGTRCRSASPRASSPRRRATGIAPVERLTTAVATGKEQGADALADRAAAILARLPADPPSP